MNKTDQSVMRIELQTFENPVTQEQFQFSATPIMIDVINPELLEDSQKQDRVIKIYCGDNHTFAVTEAGKLWSWGLGSDGQLGV